MADTTINVSVSPQYDALSKARSARDDAIDARDLSELWASAGEDVEVQNGEYSALHHATKASGSATAAQQAESEAKSARDAAQAAESGAQTAESNAQAAKTDAESARDTAQTAASNASASASTAQTAASDAESARDAAQTARDGAQAAETDAKNARDAAQQAETGATSAKNAAQMAESNAQQHEDDAETAKNTAQTEASAASGHADDAQQAATDAQESADDALASSSFVDIVDTEPDLSSISSPSSGDQALVRDDTANSNGHQAIYEYDGSSWSFTGHSLVSEGQRNQASGFVGLDQHGYVEHERAIYVDSRNGSDSNDGKSGTTPVKTLAEALSIAQNEGITQVRLRRGSIFREEVINLASEVDYIGAYGDGALPILSGDEVIDTSNITTETAPNGDTVYKFDTTTQIPLDLGSVGLPYPNGNAFNGLEGQAHKMMFEGEKALETIEHIQDLGSEGEYLDLLTQNPGHFYIPGDSSPDPARQNDSITDGVIYFLPNGSTDPTSDSKTYSYVPRQRIMRGDNMILEDFAYGRWYQRYPFNMTYCVIRNVHGFQIPQHTLMARSSYLEGCSADNTDMGYSGFHGFHDGTAYDSRGPLGLVYRDCVAKTGGNGGIAFYSHGGGSPDPRPYTLVENCRAPGGWSSGISLGNAQLLIVTNYEGTGNVTTNCDLMVNGYMKSGGGASNRTNTLPKRLKNTTVVMVGNLYANLDQPFTAELIDCALISTGGRYASWVQNGEADITLNNCLVGDFDLTANDFTLEGGTQSYIPEAGVLRDVQATMEADPAGTDRLPITASYFDPARETWLFDDSGTAPNGESYNAVMEVNNFGSGRPPINQFQCWEFQGSPFPSPWAVEVADYEPSSYQNNGNHTVYLRQALPSGRTFDGSTRFESQTYALLQAIELQRANESFYAYANDTNDKLRFVRTGLTPAEAKRYIASGQYLQVEGVGLVETASIPYGDGNVSGSWVVDLAESYPELQTIALRFLNGNTQGFDGGDSYLQNRYEFTVRTNLPIYKPTGNLSYTLNSSPSWLGQNNPKSEREKEFGFGSHVPPSLQGVDQADGGKFWNEEGAFAAYVPVAYDCTDPENPASVQIDVSWRILDESDLPTFLGDFKNGEQAFQAPDSPQQGLGPIPEEAVQAESISARYRLNNVT